jgi:hypothetical protein
MEMTPPASMIQPRDGSAKLCEINLTVARSHQRRDHLLKQRLVKPIPTRFNLPAVLTNK